MDHEQLVEEQYGADSLVARVEAALRAANLADRPIGWAILCRSINSTLADYAHRANSPPRSALKTELHSWTSVPDWAGQHGLSPRPTAAA